MTKRLESAEMIIIDDHAALVENLRAILEAEGAFVRSASNAAQGVRLAEQPFDVALVDIRLPDARGLSIIPQLKAQDDTREIVLVTGHATIEDAIEAVRAGAYAYVLKPFDPVELITTMDRALQQVRLRRETASLQSTLRRNEAALRTLVNTVQALLLVLDDRCEIIQANAAVAKATGTDMQELLGSDWVEGWITPRYRAAFRDACHELQRTNEVVSVETSVINRATAAQHVVSWRLAALWVEGDLRIYASGIDVTDIRELERRTRLAEKLAAVGTIAAGLAHEIRNPLNAAGLQLMLLERRLAKIGDHPKLTDPAQIVREQIDRLGRLVTDFLEFARPQALTIARTDVAAVIDQVLQLLAPVAELQEVGLHHEFSQGIAIYADHERLTQMVLNLARNAIEACGKGGTVTVCTSATETGVCIVVRDTGPGIAEEISARIFEPFFTTKESGTGLGMAITHSLVDLHGGSIEVGPGPGGHVVVNLPQRPPRPL